MTRKRGMIIVLAALSAACAPVPIEAPVADAERIARGEAAAVRLGCGACHDMPGVTWPKGRLGPALAGFGDRPLIAGRLPNTVPTLAAFVRDAPILVPETAMPAVPMRDAEAQDIAAWLQSLRD